MPQIKCCEHCEPPKRHSGCHGNCPEYAKEREPFVKEAQRRLEKNRIDGVLIEMKTKAVRK